MIRSIIISISLLGVQSADAYWAQFRELRFTQVNSITGIPTGFMKAILLITNSRDAFSNGLIADRGERYRTTDVVRDPKLPSRRLIFAGVSGEKSFIYYEHGGIGHHTHLLVFSGNESNGYKLDKNVCPDGPVAKDVEGLKRSMMESKEWPAYDA